MATNRARAEKMRGSAKAAPFKQTLKAIAQETAPAQAATPRDEASRFSKPAQLHEIPGVSESEFEETVLCHFAFLHSMALKITRSEDDAQDLVQETILRAYRFFDKYEQGTNCKAWLYRIMKNTFINNYRKTRRHQAETSYEEIEEVLDAEVDAPAATADPQASFINSRLREEVAEALELLPSDYRFALSLSLVDGFSYKEIAKRMGCPIGTVMSRIHRGRLILKEKLAPLAAETGWWHQGQAAIA